TAQSGRTREDLNQHDHAEGKRHARFEGDADCDRHAYPRDETPTPADRTIARESRLGSFYQGGKDRRDDEQPDPTLRESPQNDGGQPVSPGRGDGRGRAT